MEKDERGMRLREGAGRPLKGRSVARKINVSLCFILIPALAVLILITCYIAAKEVTSLSYQITESQTQNAVNTVDEFFGSKLKTVEMFSYNDTFRQMLEQSPTTESIFAASARYDAVSLLKQAYDTMVSDEVQATWLAGVGNDTYLMYTGETVPADLKSTDWDEKMLVEKKTMITAPFFDPATGRKVISAVAPIFTRDKSVILGFVGFDVFQDQLSRILQDIQIGENGTLELVSESGLLVYSFDPAILNQAVEDVPELSSEYTDGIRNHYEGSLNYRYQGETYHSIFAESTVTDWIAVGSIPLAEVTAPRNRLIMVMIVISVLMLAVILFTVVTLVKRILAPLHRIASNAELFSRGDLSVEIDVESNDEIGGLADSVRRMIGTLQELIVNLSTILSEISKGNLCICVEGDYQGDFRPIREALTEIIRSLNHMLSQIYESADQVSSGADQVSGGAQMLSQGAAEQAGSIEELAASIDEISAQVEENSKNALEASDKARRLGDGMTKNQEQMELMISAMDEIRNNSNRISEIIKVIDDIAFQTNLLALNAAVEAARAGETGRGFAVVAEEVRNLAGKSSQASKNTASLIEKSIESVHRGTQIADATAQALFSVVEEAVEVAVTVDKISKASLEQSHSISAVNESITQIASVVQNNSATAEESAAASEELSSQAMLLKGYVSRFRLEENQSGQTPRERKTENT